MLTSFVDESPTKKVLTFDVPAEDVKAATEKLVKAFAKQARLPGFRPGKAPAHIIRQRFAEEIKGEVLERLIQESLAGVLREKNLVPLGQPRIGDLKFEFEAPLSFKIDLEVRPSIEPKDYRGLKVPAGSTAVAPEDVDRILARIREGHSTYDAVEGRPVKDGDFALVDIKGSFPAGDGEDFTREKVLVEIGGEGTLPELSAHLRNAEAGATVSFQKSFAADVSDSEFAGKTVLYTVHLVAIKTRVLPALDDELARLALTPREGEAPEGASLEMLKEKIAESVVKEKEQAVREQKRRAALDGLLALNEVAAPESMVESEVDSALKEYARQMTRQGLDLKDAKIDWNEMRKEARPSAERRVKEYLLLDAIGEKEGLAVTDTELDAELKRRAQAMGMSFTELKGALAKADRLEGVREELRIDRVVDFLVAEAVVAG
ncbi:MAG TPA: trigger factor [Thermoanaerobaculia bacterium]|nr:trigger factor [Thermoanaerobaculia bacterium]